MSPQEELPLASIITLLLNQGRFIRDTVESALSQHYPRLEYLVMDGDSTDETVEILLSYGDRVIWRLAPDRGQADAVNTGFRLASGEVRYRSFRNGSASRPLNCCPIEVTVRGLDQASLRVLAVAFREGVQQLVALPDSWGEHQPENDRVDQHQGSRDTRESLVTHAISPRF